VGKIHIGTSGWHYKHWLGNFYPASLPASQMLSHYSQHFSTVELNNTFYKLPSPSSLAAWRDSTPADFTFAVKGSRFLTHMKKLHNAADGLRRFLDAVELLHPKLSVILFQLPPNWELNLNRLAEFLDLLPPGNRYVFEFRNPTWNTAETCALLSRHNAGYCIFDLAGYVSPHHITANFAYIRLHGPGAKYQGSYSDSALQCWAQRIKAWNRDVYIYFDNDDSGYAPQDALRLTALCQSA